MKELLWNKLLAEALLNVVSISKSDVRYLKLDESDSLTMKAFRSLLQLVKERRRPVKVKEIAERIYGRNVTKNKEDSIRIVLERCFVRKGIVRKISPSGRTVYYMPSAYRFRVVEGNKLSLSDDSLVEIPREYWPFPESILSFYARMKAIKMVLEKIERDYVEGRIDREVYERATKHYSLKLSSLVEECSKFKPLIKLLDEVCAKVSA